MSARSRIDLSWHLHLHLHLNDRQVRRFDPQVALGGIHGIFAV